MKVPETNQIPPFVSCSIVDLESVREIRNWDNGTVEIVFKNGSRVVGVFVPSDTNETVK